MIRRGRTKKTGPQRFRVVLSYELTVDAEGPNVALMIAHAAVRARRKSSAIKDAVTSWRVRKVKS